MSAPGAVALVLGCVAVATDLWRGTIPNWLTAGGVAAGLACGLASGGARGLGWAAAGALAGFAVFFLMHAMGGMGGGDVKLMAAFGSLLGPAGTLACALLASVAGGLLATASSIVSPGRGSIPYGPAIVAGAWLVILGRS